MLRRTATPYNVNAVALACLMEALQDQEYVRNYAAEVRRNRAALERVLGELGFPYWPSQANFVLFKVGDWHKEFVRGMKEQGILVRDRSSDPGCDGCVRITVGTDEQTERLIAALRVLARGIGAPERKLTMKQGVKQTKAQKRAKPRRSEQSIGQAIGRRRSSARRPRPRSTSGLRWKVVVNTTFPPAFAFSITCSSFSPGTAASI